MSRKLTFRCAHCKAQNVFDTVGAQIQAPLLESQGHDQQASSAGVYVVQCSKCGKENRISRQRKQ